MARSEAGPRGTRRKWIWASVAIVVSLIFLLIPKFPTEDSFGVRVVLLGTCYLGRDEGACRSIHHFEMACRFGDGEVCRNIASDMEDGTAIKWYRQGCKWKDALSCSQVVSTLSKNGLEESQEVQKTLEMTCIELRDPVSCGELAARHIKNRNYQKAFSYFDKACKSAKHYCDLYADVLKQVGRPVEAEHYAKIGLKAERAQYEIDLKDLKNKKFREQVDFDLSEFRSKRPIRPTSPVLRLFLSCAQSLNRTGAIESSHLHEVFDELMLVRTTFFQIILTPFYAKEFVLESMMQREDLWSSAVRIPYIHKGISGFIYYRQSDRIGTFVGGPPLKSLKEIIEKSADGVVHPKGGGVFDARSDLDPSAVIYRDLDPSIAGQLFKRDGIVADPTALELIYRELNWHMSSIKRFQRLHASSTGPIPKRIRDAQKSAYIASLGAAISRCTKLDVGIHRSDLIAKTKVIKETFLQDAINREDL